MEKSLYSTEYQVFLELLKRAREKAGLTQETVAQRLGTTQSHISKCERGERRIDIVELRKWCQALDAAFVPFVQSFQEVVAAKNVRPRRRS